MLPYIASLVLMLASAIPAMAQVVVETEATKGSFAENNQTEIIITLFAATMVIMIFVVVYLSTLLVSMTKSVLTEKQQDALADVEFIPFAKIASWTVISKTLTNAVPIEQEDTIELDHDYDGIKELDNHLPPWWTAMFYASIVFAVVYVYYYHFTDTDRSQLAEYEQDMTIAQEKKDIYLTKMANLVNESNVTALADGMSLSNGKNIYIQYCAACHGQAGEGGVGPNFADDYWIHGGGIKNVFKTVKYGVPEKGMIAWQDQMSPKDMQDVSSYILTMKGTNPPNAKEPQGDIWVEDAIVAPVDTLTQGTIEL